MKETQSHEVKDNLDPVLLFTAVQEVEKEKKEHGVYFVPQQGIGMRGLPFDGSTVSVARRIANMFGKVQIIPGEIKDINPEPSVESIVGAVNAWMHTWMGKGDPEPVLVDDTDDEI